MSSTDKYSGRDNLTHSLSLAVICKIQSMACPYIYVNASMYNLQHISEDYEHIFHYRAVFLPRGALYVYRCEHVDNYGQPPEPMAPLIHVISSGPCHVHQVRLK